MKDLVKCCNCGWKGKVKLGESICPNCNGVGFLAWQDEDNQEVED